MQATHSFRVDDWKKEGIKREAFSTTSALDDDTSSHMVNLAAKGNTVAIAAFEDPTYDFYA